VGKGCSIFTGVCLGARDAFTVRIVSELHTEEGAGLCLLVVLFTVIVTLYLSPLAPSTLAQQDQWPRSTFEGKLVDTHKHWCFADEYQH
jgi:hypothetical protein